VAVDWGYAPARNEAVGAAPGHEKTGASTSNPQPPQQAPTPSSQPTPNPAAILVAFPLPVPLRHGLREAPRRFVWRAPLAAEATERA